MQAMYLWNLALFYATTLLNLQAYVCHVTTAENLRCYLGRICSSDDACRRRTLVLHRSDTSQHQLHTATGARRHTISIHRRTVHRLLHFTNTAKSLLWRQQWIFIIVVVVSIVTTKFGCRLRTEEETPVETTDFVQPLVCNELVSQQQSLTNLLNLQ